MTEDAAYFEFRTWTLRTMRFTEHHPAVWPTIQALKSMNVADPRWLENQTSFDVNLRATCTAARMAEGCLHSVIMEVFTSATCTNILC